MSRTEEIFWCFITMSIVIAMLFFTLGGQPRRPCQIVTIAVPGPVAVIRVDGSTILVNEKEFTLPAGDTRFTVRVLEAKSP